MFSKIYDPLLTLVYPQACRICRNSVENFSDGAACRDCWGKTCIFDGSETLCAKCGGFLRAESTDFQTFCHRCDEHFYDAARAVGKYEMALEASIIRLKSEPVVAERLQKNFLECFAASDFLDSTLIIPVPLSPKRLMERGFNQARVLADLLAGKFNLPVDEHSLIRSIHTPMHRAAMDTKARKASVRNVFKVAASAAVSGETILLVDDVFTSGATVSACAKALKERGAGKIYVLTISRAG